jgi:hypothetical protein
MELTPSTIVFLVSAAGCGAASAYFTFREIEEVNRRLPQEAQVEYALIYPGKMRRIRRAYKQLYPEGVVDRWRIVFEAAAFVFIALTALAAGFPR